MDVPDSVIEPPAAGKPQGVHPLGRLPSEWEQWVVAEGQAPYRAAQVFRWLHQRAEMDPEAMTNLDKGTRRKLVDLGLDWPLSVERVQRSSDGTRKLLLRLDDGRLLECVLIPMTNEADADVAACAEDEGEVEGFGQAAPRRVTLCVSTQVGCAMACGFCASGRAGLQRGLRAAEIVAQVLLSERYLDSGEQLRNLVFMGMGEPLHHYVETRRAIQLLTDPQGKGFSPRRITVSTVGLVSGIHRLGRDFDGKLGLAVSLHAPDDETRNQIMPVNRRYDVAQLIAALREYPLPKRRRITIEYTLIRDVNDSEPHAHRLARLLSKLRVKINLIPMNPVAGSPFRAPQDDVVEAFRKVLAGHRISCSLRKRRGDDVDAACGQLALREQGSPSEGNLIGLSSLHGPASETGRNGGVPKADREGGA